ncbi:MAG: hypothetical protein NW223_09530 [Hyphomicrobiaceae bacterium]|nr:hypothetical protein [Hyphomicrobiaceae bacterium]
MGDDQQSTGRAWLYLVSKTLRHLGLLVVVLALVRLGIVMFQASLQNETVATIEDIWVQGSACLAQDLALFTMLHGARLKGKSEAEIAAEYARQCADASTSGSNVTLTLSWNDQDMRERKTMLLVSTAVADRLIRHGRRQRDAVRVRYSPANPDATLVLMEEVENSHREALYMLAGAALAVLLGLAGGAWHRRLLRAA